MYVNNNDRNWSFGEIDSTMCSYLEKEEDKEEEK